MSWDKVRDIYLDARTAGGPAVLLTEKTAIPLAEQLQFVQGDKFTLRLWFRIPDEDDNSSEAVEMPAGSVIVIAAKPAAMIGLPILLFFEDEFAANGAGDDLCYQATLDLNTDELESALLAADSVAVVIDIEVQDATNAERMTYRIPATVLRQAYGTESEPSPGTPTYPAPSTLVIKQPTGGSYRFDTAGQHLQLWDPDLSQWRTLIIESGALALGPGEE